MPSFSQAGRPLSLSTALPADALLLTGLAGTEALSSPFDLSLDLLAQSPVAFGDVLGRPASVTLRVPGSPERTIRGVVASLTQGDRVSGVAGGDTFVAYRARLRPRLSLLAHSRRSRVWQGVTVNDVVAQVVRAEWGLDLRDETAGTPTTRDYLVQYNESDLDFVSRLLEDEGIWYAFDHTGDRETMVLGNTADAFADLPGAKTLTYLPASGGLSAQGRVTGFAKTQAVGVRHASVGDYSFQLPLADLDAGHDVAASAVVGTVTHPAGSGLDFAGSARMTTFDYPAGYGRRFDGVAPGGTDRPEDVARLYTENVRLAALDAARAESAAFDVRAVSDLGHLQPGYAVALSGHFDADGDYQVIAVTHAADLSGAYLRGGDEFRYSSSFTLLPTSVPFVPQKVTPRPRITGVQTARVAGPDGQDIFVDKYGRVKVRFHWDRSATTGPENSCWLRVAQVWAGRRWGGFFWPRVHHEVIVAFEEGDPDRPIITGSVYNDRNMPPFELPANRVKGGIKSFSASGDSNALCDQLRQFNGFVFHDEAGNEHFEVHSEKQHYQDDESDSRHNVNGHRRVNASSMHSLHVGSLPASSGSGGGDASPTWSFNPKIDLGHGFGINYASVAGINHGSTLGLMSNIIVGDRVQFVANPLGLISDSVRAIPSLGALGSILTGMAGPLFGGVLNLNLGASSNVTVGSPLNITRSGKSPITSASNFEGSLDAVDKGFMIAGTAAAYASVALVATGMIYTTLHNYEDDKALWGGLLGAGGGLALLWTEVETVRAIYQQSKKAANAATAAANLLNSGLTAKGFATTANTLTTLFTNDMTNLNDLKYTGGCVGEYSKSRIVGTEDGYQLFCGAPLPVVAPGLGQTVVAMDPSHIKLVVGALPLPTSIAMDTTSLTLGVGPTCKLTMTPTDIELTVVPTVKLKLDATSVTLTCGTFSLKLDTVTGFQLSDGIGFGVKFDGMDFNVDAVLTQIQVDSYTLKTLALQEEVTGIVNRTGAATMVNS